MIHELREYKIDARVAEDYFSLFRDLAMRIRGSDYGRLLANWLVPGPVVTFYHLWEYDSLAERTAKRAALAEIERWSRDFLPKATTLIASQRLTIMTPYIVDGTPEFARDDIKADRVEFATVRCRTGTAAAVASAIVCEGPPGLRRVWTEEMPDPNVVRFLCEPGQTVAVEWLEARGAVHQTTETWEKGPC